MKSRRFLLLGGGGHASVVADAMRAGGHEVMGFVDDGPLTPMATERIGAPFLGGTPQLWDLLGTIDEPVELFPAVGSNSDRLNLIETLERHRQPQAPPIAHPSAYISETARLEPLVFVGPRAIVNPGAFVGRGAMINSGSIVEHDCSIGNLAHIAPGAILCGAAKVGTSALIGAGAVVLPGVTIGNGATLGAGAVANKDVPEGHISMGVPAR